MSVFHAMHTKVSEADGFLAALDQSGGSTPKALKLYGIPDSEYTPGDDSMYDAVHKMRTRIITSPGFTGDQVLGAILFEDTMNREIEGIPTGQYLWEKKHIVPFLKIDKGLMDEKDGVQLMKPIPGLDELLEQAKQKGFYGTKMRSVINSANETGIKAIVEQQFEIAKQIIGHKLIPIIEPEVNINATDKEQCEDILKKYLLEHLDALGDDDRVMLKLTIPTKDNLYAECIAHPKCVRVVALSGGYSCDEACQRLAKQKGMIASFSRALTEKLSHQMDDEKFHMVMAKTVDTIYEASKSG
ncbi:hypothetical protein MPSEU_000809000 [Mayamaea pseudoterrestris]|nr:hypothetical protein MPSEU_000809000 [Mayamaea pseudoterrestris]